MSAVALADGFDLSEPAMPAPFAGQREPFLPSRFRASSDRAPPAPGYIATSMQLVETPSSAQTPMVRPLTTASVQTRSSGA